MAKKYGGKLIVWVMLILFLGSVVGGAIEYGFGRQRAKMPETNIVQGPLSQAQEYAILSSGNVLLIYSIPSDCTFFCQAEVQRVENVVQKYAPYVFLEEIKEGTKMKMVAAAGSSEETLDNVNATAVEDTICLAISRHPECRRVRALQALEAAKNITNTTNISLGG